MEEDRLAALVLEHFVEALRLTVTAINLVDTPREITLQQIQDMETARQRLEVSAAALLQLRGVSWETMATELGVKRQSLHRRLARKSLAYQALKRNAPSLEREYDGLINVLSEKADELASTTPRTLSHRVARTLSGPSH